MARKAPDGSKNDALRETQAQLTTKDLLSSIDQLRDAVDDLSLVSEDVQLADDPLKVTMDLLNTLAVRQYDYDDYHRHDSKQVSIRYSTSITTLLMKITCHLQSHSVTCHPAAVTFPPLPQPKLLLDLATPEGCKAEFT